MYCTQCQRQRRGYYGCNDEETGGEAEYNMGIVAVIVLNTYSVLFGTCKFEMPVESHMVRRNCQQSKEAKLIKGVHKSKGTICNRNIQLWSFGTAMLFHNFCCFKCNLMETLT